MRGTFLGGIVEAETGVVGVGDVAVFAFIEVATAPWGRGSEVLGLADPGKTTGFESEMLGFGLLAYPLYNFSHNQLFEHFSMGRIGRAEALTRPPDATRPACSVCH